jgi:hypothetical protein
MAIAAACALAYAAIQVDLWDEGAVLEDILARHGIDEIKKSRSRAA